MVIFKATNPERSYHHSTSNPLHTEEHARDAFDVWTQLLHGGDTKQAFAAAKKEQGKWTEPPPAATSSTILPAWLKEAPAIGDLAAHTNGAGGDSLVTDLVEKGKHDLGNAVYTHTLYGDRFLFNDGLGWLYWTGTHWSGDTAEAKVHGATVKALKQRCAVALQSDDVDLLRAATPSAKHTRDTLFHFRYLVTIGDNSFDSEPHLLNVANGVIDLRSGEMAAHESSNRFTYCVPTEYHPGARSDLWDGLLGDWFSYDVEMVDYVARCLGYSVTGKIKEETLFYVKGPGRAGKGTLVNTVGEVLGHQLTKGVKFDVFTDSRNDPQNFRLAPLHHSRMVIASESKRSERFDEGLVKQLTGRDPIEAAFKHKTGFTFTPRFKLWLMSNYPHAAMSMTTAFGIDSG